MQFKNILSDKFENHLYGYDSLKCECDACQENSSQATLRLGLHRQLESSQSINHDYRELVWDYQGLKDRLGSRKIVEYSLYKGSWEFTKTYNHRGHELSVMRHSLEQSQFIESVFLRLDDLIDLDFEQVESDQTGDIRIYRAYDNSEWSNDFKDPNALGGGTMYGQSAGIDLEWRDMYSEDAFNVYEKSTIVHEIGHSLGLSHPGGVGANPDWDEWDSIMSYNDRSGVNEEPIWFSALDIQAMQSIWGVENDVSPKYIRTDFIIASTWSAPVRINREINVVTGDILQAAQVEKGEHLSGFVGSIINGDNSSNIIRGLAGFDVLTGKAGNDLIHGGNGRDIIDGGSGSDELHGDFGWNTFKNERDSSIDLIAIKSDQYLINSWDESAGNNPNGEKADFIEGLDSWDHIKIIGVSTEDLNFKEGITARGVSGIGIYANEALEAVYTGGDLSLGQITEMTSGETEMKWSYWGDSTVAPDLLA